MIRGFILGPRVLGNDRPKVNQAGDRGQKPHDDTRYHAMPRCGVQRLTGENATRDIERDRSSEERDWERNDHRVYRVLPDDSSTFHIYLLDRRERDDDAFRLAGLRAPELRAVWLLSDPVRPRGEAAFRAVDLTLPDPLDFFPPPLSLFTVAHARLEASFRGTDLPSYPSAMWLAWRFCF